MVREALEDWARKMAVSHPEVVRIGCFGSYVRGDWGVGSDLDVVVVLQGGERVFGRVIDWLEATGLPVPVDLLVYSEEEYERLVWQEHFPCQEVVWLALEGGK